MKIHQNRTCFMLQDHGQGVHSTSGIVGSYPTRPKSDPCSIPRWEGPGSLSGTVGRRVWAFFEYGFKSGGPHARSEVLHVFSGSRGPLKPVFEAILAKVTRFGSSLRRHSQTPRGTSH